MNIIYKATHKPTGKFYIGKTKHSLNIRVQQHFNAKVKYCYKFYEFLITTKKEDWDWEIVGTTKFEELAYKLETMTIHLLDAYNVGLNSKPGFDSDILKELAAEKLAEYRKKNPDPWHKGRKNVYSDESLIKMSLAKLVNPSKYERTQELKDNLSKKHGKRLKELTTGLEFSSIARAAQHFNIRRELVRDVVNGKRNHTHGYTFQYL